MTKLILRVLFLGIVFTTCKSENQEVTSPIKITTNRSDSIPNHSTDQDTSVSYLDDSLYRIIESLPEIKNFDKRYNFKKLDKNLRVQIAKRPNKLFPYFWIQVGVVDQDRFQPIYNFYINKDNRQILYLDTVNDDTISLKKWRTTRAGDILLKLQRQPTPIQRFKLHTKKPIPQTTIKVQVSTKALPEVKGDSFNSYNLR